MIYLDNASTSYDKHESVIAAMGRTFGNPLRGSHSLAVDAVRTVFEAREKTASFLGVKDSANVIFTSGATESLNLAILGFLNKGDHVILSAMEHNAVSRPLYYLQQQGLIELSVIPCNDGIPCLHTYEKSLQKNTKLIAMIHGSNVCGTIIPIKEFTDRKASAAFLLDASQTAGYVPLSVSALGVDMLAFSAHKYVNAMMGTGVLYVDSGVCLRPLKYGGTGGISDAAEIPDQRPECFEAGTCNINGIAALSAALDEVCFDRSMNDAFVFFVQSLEKLKGVRVFSSIRHNDFLPIVSLAFDRLDCNAVSNALDQRFGVIARGGLHCASLAHRSLGTYPQGTLRFSPGKGFDREQALFVTDCLRTVFNA